MRNPLPFITLLIIVLVTPTLGYAQNDTIASKSFNILNNNVFSLSKNKEVKISELIRVKNKDQVNIVITWAKWCPPCTKAVIETAKLESSNVHFIVVQMGTKFWGDKYFLNTEEFKTYVATKFDKALKSGVEFVTEEASSIGGFYKETKHKDLPMHYFFAEDALIFWKAGYKEAESMRKTLKGINLWEKHYVANKIIGMKFTDTKDIYVYKYDINSRLLNYTFAYRSSTMTMRKVEFYPNGHTKTITLKNTSTEKEKIFEFSNSSIPIKANK